MPDIHLRNATDSDENLLFKWRNIKELVALSYFQKKVTLDEHKKWFRNKLKSSNCELFIIQLNDQVFNRDQYVKTIDTKFSEFGVAPIATPIDPGYTVYDFFKDYSRLLPSIPDEGEFNSKQYLIQRSGNYVYEEAINNTISELFFFSTIISKILSKIE